MKIGVFGLGIIGAVWAQHWRADGHEVRGWNRTAKPDYPFFCADAVEAARDADLIAICVADGAAVHAVLDLILPVLGSHSVVAQHSTVLRTDALRAAERVRATGATFLDMPFTGSAPAAVARQTVFYVGSTEEEIARVTPVYRTISRAIVPIGAVGDAMALKLAMNVLVANVTQGFVEAYSLATAAGVTQERFQAALEQHAGRSGLTDMKLPKLREGDFTPQFSVKHMHKDLRCAAALAAEYGLPLKQSATLEKSYVEAEAAGLSELDFVSLVKLLQCKKGGI